MYIFTQSFDNLSLETPQITVYQEFAREITEGQNTTFVCSATGIPGPTIKWVDQDGRMIDSLTDSRLSVFGGNLMVSGVIKSDAAKTYFCQASNSVGQDTVNATITKVWSKLKCDTRLFATVSYGNISAFFFK